MEGEVSRSEILQSNERIKSLSNLCSNFGTALTIAGAARWFYSGFDLHVLLWLIGGPLLIWSGLHFLTLLEAEE